MSTELIPYADIEKMGTAVAESGLFGVKTVKQAVALMLVAQAYGKHPAQAAMEYNIINNRPAKKAEAMLASFQEAGGKVKWIELTDKKAEAEFSHPSGGTLVLAWTFEMAKQAGLVDKEYSNYKKYPRAMLRSRVVAEGVRAVYPAATGGMLSKEEAEDIVEVIPDGSKSRVEQIIEAHVEPEGNNEDSHASGDGNKSEGEVKKDEPTPKTTSRKSSSKAEGKTDKVDSKIVHEAVLPAGVKQVIGLIEEIPKTATLAKGQKWSFKIGELRYGTFDKSIADKVMECIDNHRMVRFEYTERKEEKDGKINHFNDIVNFREAVADENMKAS